MTTQTQVVFTIDPTVKAQAMKRAKREGVPFASVLKLATKAYAQGRFAVDIAPPERFNEKTAREIRAASKDIDQGKNLSPAFSNMDDAISWLERNDR
jgi:antitoxin component of RelBE/YafQ-DinJ toxin-antitoxin module